MDVQKTIVLALPLAEASAKARRGDPVDELDDLTGPWWAGVVPVTTRFERPLAAADLTNGAAVPDAIAALGGLTPDERLGPV
jgi:hypothetical protein